MGASKLMPRVGGAIVLVLRRRPRAVTALELVMTGGSDQRWFSGRFRTREQNTFSRTSTRKGATNA